MKPKSLRANFLQITVNHDFLAKLTVQVRAQGLEHASQVLSVLTQNPLHLLASLDFADEAPLE